MVKICPSCGMRNFDDAKICTSCFEKIRDAAVIEHEIEDVMPGFKPRGMDKQVFEGRIYTKTGASLFILYISLYILFWFYWFLDSVYEAIILLVFALLIILCGRLAMTNGDRLLGKYVLLLGFILIFFTAALAVNLF
jgi:hypothetical protein